jgi:hypothetical protein
LELELKEIGIGIERNWNNWNNISRFAGRGKDGQKLL